MRKPSKVYQCAKFIQHLFYPSRCLLCDAPGTEGRDLCADCLSELPHNPVACRLCALPLAGHESGLCGNCIKRPPPLDGSIIPFRYAAPLDQLLLGLKFKQQLCHARLLGNLLAEAIAAQGDKLPDCILPVPLHPSRTRERGYNQALELAYPVSKELDIPIVAQLARREVATTAQSSLAKRERRRNIKGVFSVQSEVPAHVALLDDVVTTGSTVNELARMVRQAGATRVVVWACAKVP